MLTPELLEQRRGKITASQAHSIMAGWDAPKPTDEFPVEIYDWIDTNGEKPKVGTLKDLGFEEVSAKLIDAAWKAHKYDNPEPSKGLLTYAETIACDTLFEHDPSTDFTSVHMENGNEREEEAARLLIEATGLPFTKTGEDQIHVSIGDVGATPDAIVYDDMDLIVTGAEIKCRSALHHARQFFITDNKSLLQHDFARYCQMQVCCYVAGAEDWYSVSYNPYAIEDEHKFHYCIIKRDEEFINVFKQRVGLTLKHKEYFLSKVERRFS